MWRTKFPSLCREFGTSDLQGYGSPLIDDGSRMAQTLQDQYAQQYDWVTSHHKVNGFCLMLELWGLESKGDWDFFSPDPDDYLEPCALELLSRATKSRTQVDMVSGKVEPTANYNRFRNFHLIK